MRRRGASDDAVEVEMVEVDDLTGVDGAGPPLVPEADARDSDPHARRARVLRWVGAGVLAALATGVVVVNVQAAREAAARQAALADLPWVLPHMDGPLEVATGAQVSSVTLDGAVLFSESVDGDVVLSFVRSDAGMTVLRLDPHTGEVLWTHRSDPGVLPEGAFGSWSYGAVDGVLRIGTGELDLAIALDDGTVVASSPSDTADSTVPVARLADGGTVEWTYQPTGSDGTVRVLEPDGT